MDSCELGGDLQDERGGCGVTAGERDCKVSEEQQGQASPVVCLGTGT